MSAASTAATTPDSGAVSHPPPACSPTVHPPESLAAVLGNGSAGHESVPVAVYTAAANGSFDEAVNFGVRCGGDSDTIGAMAGAIAGASHGADATPARWRDALEDGEKGRSHVERLAERLVS